MLAYLIIYIKIINNNSQFYAFAQISLMLYNWYGDIMHTNYKNNLNTKIKLANSLKEILKHKPLSKITINEITSNINVNRNTFN